jgi:hypothetical protein
MAVEAHLECGGDRISSVLNHLKAIEDVYSRCSTELMESPLVTQGIDLPTLGN